jgi:CheY-like chemotaxis protein
MNNFTTEDLEARLASMREAYAERLPEKIGQLDELWQTLQTCSSDEVKTQSTLKELHFLIHRLSGTGASYGFTALSAAARTLELYLKPLFTDKVGSSLTEAQMNNITALFCALKQAALQPDWVVSTTPLPGQAELQVSPLLAEPIAQEDKLIFLVEANLPLAQELAKQISGYGYTVRTIETPRSLKAALKHQWPAVIIMDVMFPEGEFAGIEAIAELQLHQGSERLVPVLFISSREDLLARLQSVRAGGVGFFTTPINLSVLINTLDMLTVRQTPEPYRVLIVENQSTQATFYSQTLQQAGMITTIITNPMQVMRPLIEFVPDLILMASQMSGCTGLEVAAIIRQQSVYLSIPIIFLSTKAHLNQQLLAMRLGGDAFLTMPVETDHLISVVFAMAERSRLLRTFEEQLETRVAERTNALREDNNHLLAQLKELQVRYKQLEVEMNNYKIKDVYADQKSLSWQ